MADFDGKPGGLFQGSSPCSTKGTDDTAASFSDWAVPGSPDANHVIAKDLTAGELATFVNTICAVEEKQPGIVAKDPLWAYNLGVQMFGV